MGPFSLQCLFVLCGAKAIVGQWRAVDDVGGWRAMVLKVGVKVGLEGVPPSYDISIELIILPTQLICVPW